jgi:hypothetical protein
VILRRRRHGVQEHSGCGLNRGDNGCGVWAGRRERVAPVVPQRLCPAYTSSVATTTIEIDSELLVRLRSRHPGKDDRALIEELARIDLGFAALRDSQRRNSLDEADASELAVHVVHEARRASR